MSSKSFDALVTALDTIAEDNLFFFSFLKSKLLDHEVKRMRK